MRGNKLSLLEASKYVENLALGEEQEVKRVVDAIGNSADVDGWKAIYNTTDGRIAAIVTDKYQLVQHRDFFSTALEAIKNLDLEVGHVSVKDARERVDFEVVPVDAEIFGGERIALGLRLSNSINASIGARVEAYGLRLVCTNGLIGRTVFGGKSMIHVGENISVERVADGIEEVIPIAKANLNKVVLSASSAQVGNAKEVLEEAGFGKIYQKEIIAGFYAGTIDPETGEASRELTRWDLYCRATEVIDHKHIGVTENTREDMHRRANELLLSPAGE